MDLGLGSQVFALLWCVDLSCKIEIHRSVERKTKGQRPKPMGPKDKAQSTKIKAQIY
jgi:hypothetical protein